MKAFLNQKRINVCEHAVKMAPQALASHLELSSFLRVPLFCVIRTLCPYGYTLLYCTHVCLALQILLVTHYRNIKDPAYNESRDLHSFFTCSQILITWIILL